MFAHLFAVSYWCPRTLDYALTHMGHIGTESAGQMDVSARMKRADTFVFTLAVWGSGVRVPLAPLSKYPF